jgi:hypothetical protein
VHCGTPAPRIVAIGSNDVSHRACGIDDTGGVWCWGSLDRCEHASEVEPSLMYRVGADDFHATRIVVGQDVSCALTTPGGVACWDNGDAASEAHPTMTSLRLPGRAVDVRIVPGRELSEGSESQAAVYARLADGRIVRWGASRGGLDAAPVSTTLAELPGGSSDSGGACLSGPGGAVECHGTDEIIPMRAGYAHPRLDVSYGDWRPVPRLAGARQLGANDYCGWGIVRTDRVGVECIYGPGGEGLGCATLGGCALWKRSSHGNYRTESLEYQAPRIKRLVRFDFWLDEEGHCFRFDGKESVHACKSQ